MSKNFTGPCPICAGINFDNHDIVWPALATEWELSVAEIAYINRQQGLVCHDCGCCLRAMTLADAILKTLEIDDTLINANNHAGFEPLHILEVNTAGGLTPYLQKAKHHRLVQYPEYDLSKLDFADAQFDVVIHSDTLEHVPDFRAGLSECFRVLRPCGHLIFTVPIIWQRLTRSRRDLPASYHGAPGNTSEDHRVQTEFGADVWGEVLAAGFDACTFHCLEFPAGLAMVAVKGGGEE